MPKEESPHLVTSAIENTRQLSGSLPPRQHLPKNQATDINLNTTDLRVTFSLPMRSGSYSFVKESNDDFPKVIGKPTSSPDHKTCTLPIKLEPQHTYIIWINTDQYHSFTSESSHPATPYQLFSTTK